MSTENTNVIEESGPISAGSETPGRNRQGTTLFQKAFSFPVLMGALLVGAALLSARYNLPNPDVWWTAAIGKQIIATHKVPTADWHSFTAPGAPWMAYEWLGEVIIAVAANLGGLQGMNILLLLLTAIFVALFYGYASLVSGSSKAALIPCAISLMILKIFFSPRTQTIGYIFLIITLICLERFRQGKQKTLWVLPPLFMIWLNVHGSFVFGLVVFAIYWVSGLFEFEAGGIIGKRWTDWQRKHMEIVFLLSVLALLVSPYGSRQAAYPLQMAFFEPVNIAHINEWQSLTFQFWQTRLLLAMFILFWLAQMLLRQQFRLESILLLLFAIDAGFLHLRFIPFLMLILVPLLAKVIAKWAPPYEPSVDHFAVNAILIVMIAVVVVLFMPSRKKLEKAVSYSDPVKAIKYMDQHTIPGPTFNQYGWGGYLIYTPNYHRKVFIDGRADFYEYAGVLSDYLAIKGVKPDTLFLLRKYNIQSCLLYHNAPLGTMLSALPGWKEVYKDKVAAIYVRRQAKPSPQSSLHTQQEGHN